MILDGCWFKCVVSKLVISCSGYWSHLSLIKANIGRSQIDNQHRTQLGSYFILHLLLQKQFHKVSWGEMVKLIKLDPGFKNSNCPRGIEINKFFLSEIKVYLSFFFFKFHHVIVGPYSGRTERRFKFLGSQNLKASKYSSTSGLCQLILIFPRWWFAARLRPAPPTGTM